MDQEIRVELYGYASRAFPVCLYIVQFAIMVQHVKVQLYKCKYL